MTPMVAAASNTTKSLVAMNANPASAIKAAPTTSVCRRPQRSARVVSQSEMAVSPRSVSVSSRPMRSAVIPDD
jgi:hypothetical protein